MGTTVFRIRIERIFHRCCNLVTIAVVQWALRLLWECRARKAAAALTGKGAGHRFRPRFTAGVATAT
jgi:hypothetical protein